MNIKSLALTTSLAVSGAIASGAATPASAFRIFFSEDIGANGSVSGIPNSIDEEARFHLNLNGFGTETFESSPDGILPLSTNGVRSNPLNGRFAISGTKYYEVRTGVYTINFANPLAAFGFYATDIENKEGITLQLNDLNDTLLTIERTITSPADLANPPSGSALYYGLIAENPGETFTSIRVGMSPVSDPNKANDKFGLDDLTFALPSQVNFSATAVPEPLTIIGTLIGGSAAFRIRKKLKSSTKI
ncbi:PEP-CTERM sorting domain-containing protein [Chamaesiphon sp. VAR_48_metabat_135_sub]|uniref:PEP-CTERM sorting domain-containing protein n=1 Tax=Chamaesiphon sp. VAR_48_metabat_135_sub TaxID=2964699 RepID=UPI00286BA685|nr:PEP-CTERM sorting domain-containing protein [Chamaesiphon sp. VAR_48_metabat_135_sub]